MRQIRRIFALILLLLVMFTMYVEAFAADTELSLEVSYPENSKMSLLEEEPKKYAISYFDIGENGEFAVGRSDGLHCTVCVYTINGDFQYGYSFDHKGFSGIKFDGNNLIIYYEDNYKLISVAPSGKIESVSKILNATENRLYLHNLFCPKQRKYGDSEYILKKHMGHIRAAYCQLVMKDANGKETVLYDATTNQLFKVIPIILFIIVFVFIVIKTLVSYIIKLQSNYNSSLL